MTAPPAFLRPALTVDNMNRLYTQIEALPDDAWDMRTSDNSFENPILWLNGDPWAWLHEALWAGVRPINDSGWNLPLTGFAECLFNRYPAGQGYGWHVDHEEDNPRVESRELSLVVQLDVAREGGWFEFESGAPLLMRGEGVVFLGKTLHRAVPPVDGHRDSLVFWMFT